MVSKFTSRAEALAYADHDKPECLECGKRFAFLPSHLRKAHGMTADEYRDKFNIQAGITLAGTQYRAMHRDKIKRLQASGLLDYSHLPIAERAARLMKRVNDAGLACRKKKAGS